MVSYWAPKKARKGENAQDSCMLACIVLKLRNTDLGCISLTLIPFRMYM